MALLHIKKEKGRGQKKIRGEKIFFFNLNHANSVSLKSFMLQ